MLELRSERFAGRFQTIKSMELELKPIGKTSETIQNNQYIEADKESQERVRSFKKYIDLYAVEVYSNVFQEFTYDYDAVYQATNGTAHMPTKEQCK